MTAKESMAEFLARGGTVTQVETGKGKGLNVGYSPSNDPDDREAKKRQDKADFVLAGASREPKPKRYGRK